MISNANTITPQIDQAIRALAKEDPEQFTILHCTLKMGYFFDRYCIFPTTYLVQQDGSRSKMIHHFNISMYPLYIFKRGPSESRFTLVFERLSDSCFSFHLEEVATEDYPFYTEEISRNSSGAYSTQVFLDFDKLPGRKR